MQFLARLALLASLTLGAVSPVLAADRGFSHAGIAADAKRYETFLKSNWKSDGKTPADLKREAEKVFATDARAASRYLANAVASDDPAIRHRLVSVGRALPGVEIEIRSEEGQVLGSGERGEIYVRGEQVSGEYAGRGSALDREGWFPTRDAGSMDAEG